MFEGPTTSVGGGNLRRGPQPNRRKKSRRESDRILYEVITMLQILEKLSGGEKVDFAAHYQHLTTFKDRIGRREEDHRLGEALCSAVESVAKNINRLLEKGGQLRKVKITKMKGKPNGAMPVQTSFEGWEAHRPVVGNNYRILKNDGGIFLSAVVTHTSPRYFQTRNSLYRLEVLQESRQAPLPRSQPRQPG